MRAWAPAFPGPALLETPRRVRSDLTRERWNEGEFFSWGQSGREDSSDTVPSTGPGHSASWSLLPDQQSTQPPGRVSGGDQG